MNTIDIVNMLISAKNNISNESKKIIENIIDLSDISKNIDIIDEFKSENLIILNFIDDDICYGIVGHMNMNEIIKDLDIKEDFIIHKYPEEDEKGYLSIDLYGCISDDESSIKNIFKVIKKINDMYEDEKRFYNSSVEKQYKEWCEKSIEKETEAIIFNNKFEDTKSNREKISNWLDENAEEKGFNIDYSKEKLLDYLAHISMTEKFHLEKFI